MTSSPRLLSARPVQREVGCPPLRLSARALLVGGSFLTLLLLAAESGGAQTSDTRPGDRSPGETAHSRSARDAGVPQFKVNPETGETQAQFAARTRWWRMARFGMFIHWGVYSVPAQGEWYMNNAHVQVPDYEKYAARFNPVKFDAHRWVKIARDAGMKYIVITSKHHDGFDMFNSKLSDYNIVKATPYHHDPMKDLARECRRQGIKLCFYHSVMDWHHPDYLPRRAWETETRPADGASLDRYIQYMEGQLRELLTNYGPIGVIWFDGGWEHNADELHATEVVKLIRSLQPNILINNRIDIPEDFDTPEQTIPVRALAEGRLWETCMTLNNNWGFDKDDHNWKSAEDLTQKLCDTASKGGNFLLNVGPTDEGVIPAESVDRLEQVGRWLKVNGASVYGTSASPFNRLPYDGRCTAKGDRLYLQVFHWPEGGLKLAGLASPIIRATSLETKESLPVTTSGGQVEIGKPSRLDPFATVIELRFHEAPVVQDVPVVIEPDARGTVVLSATDVSIQGDSARVEMLDNIPSIGYWINQNDSLRWIADIPQAGDYKVEIDYACTPEAAGSTFKVVSARQFLGALPPGGGSASSEVPARTDEGISGLVHDTGAWNQFQTVSLADRLHLEAGRQAIMVVPTSMPHGAVMNLRRVALAPVEPH
jgi:alpha-L-fucosidase